MATLGALGPLVSDADAQIVAHAIAPTIGRKLRADARLIAQYVAHMHGRATRHDVAVMHGAVYCASCHNAIANAMIEDRVSWITDAIARIDNRAIVTTHAFCTCCHAELRMT